MKRKYFDGIAVHSAQVSPGKVNMFGVCFKRRITPQQRHEFMSLNPDYSPGHIGVRTNRSGWTVVMYVGRIPDKVAARKLTIRLVQSVSAITGVKSILRQLSNYKAVSRALAA